MGVEMKTKFLVFICIVAVFMLFACTDSNVGENESNAKEGVVTLSFDVEPDDAAAKASGISVNSPDLSGDMIYQYKAIANFKLSDGSAPVGSTGDVWTGLKSEMSFSVSPSGSFWTFDVRVIQKGSNYETDKEDYIVIYQTDSPLNTSITSSDKFITFTVKKIIEGTGIMHFNVSATNTKAGWLEIHLYGVPGGKEEVGEKIKGEYNDKEKKLNFINDFKFPSGFYRMTLIYNDGYEEYGYYDSLVEISDRKETYVVGEIEVRVPDPKPMVVPFYVTDGKKELKGEVSANKIVFDSKDEYEKERLILTIKGQIGNLLETKKIIINDALKKIELNAEKKVDNQVEKKVDNQAKKKVDVQNKQIEKIQPILLVKETIKYTFYCNGELYKGVKIPNEGEFDIVELKPGEYKIGVKATANLSDGSVLEIKIDPEITVIIKE